MSQNIEKIVKDSLQNYEAPYDPKAWDALQTRLDKALPTTKPTSSFGWTKISAIVFGVAGIAALSYFGISNSRDIQTNMNISQNTEERLEETKSARQISEKSSEVENTAEKTSREKSSDTNPLPKVTESPSNQGVLNGSNVEALFVKKIEQDKKIDVISPIDRDDDSSHPVQKETKVDNKSTVVVIPEITKQCLNSRLTMENRNQTELLVSTPSGRQIPISPKKEIKMRLDEAGIYRITSLENFTSKTFVVLDTKEPSFEVDLVNIWKNGVPTTNVKATSSAENYTWVVSDKNEKREGKETDLHFFTKGEKSIMLSTTDENGCKSSFTKTIEIKDDYNLFAVKAFNPSSSDSRNNHFMPLALKERNIQFRMVILEAKGGNVVYQTSDANAGWDGVDSRTGQPASNASNYIWKVNIVNPLPGESSEYKGIVLVTLN